MKIRRVVVLVVTLGSLATLAGACSSPDTSGNTTVISAESANPYGAGQVDPPQPDEPILRANQWVVLVVALVLISLVAGFLEVSRLRDYRSIHARARNERRELEEMRTALQQTEVALASQIDRERMDRLNSQWIDSGVHSIWTQLKSTVVVDEIADLLVEGVGRTLGVDFVIFYSFGKFQNPSLVKQWNKTTTTHVDHSQIMSYESRMFDFAKYLETRSRVIMVNDSHLVDASLDPFPDLLTKSQEIARSWMLVPLGEAIHELGYLWMGMAEDVRVWSAAEVALIRQVSTDAAQSLACARLFLQSMQIAENDGKVERLVELDRVKDDFIKNMNHELRTPLTSIIGYLEVIMDDIGTVVDPSLMSSLTAVQRNATRLQILTENMMQLSKTNFQQVSLVASTVDVGHLLGDVVGSLRLVAEDGGVAVTLRLDSPADDLIIDGGINQLEQVFVNLISNAVKFTPRGGMVSVAARRFHADGDYVEVKVTDTGIGIPRKEFANVFKRFFRASTATQGSIPGFGIGLSLAQSIVHQHHGAITFDSAVGKGTVFTVTLPTRYISTTPPDETT